MAPVAPEFAEPSKPDKPEKPDPTDPIKPNRISEVEAREKSGPRRNSRPEVPAGSRNPPVQRTEALSGDEVKRMIAAADRRAAARATGSNLPRTPSRQATRVPTQQQLSVGPPPEDEATSLGADDDEEATTTNPSPGTVPRPPRPGPPVGRDLEDEPVPSDGPSTARMDRIAQLAQRPMRRSPPRGEPIPGELGDYDEDDGPTVSAARSVKEPLDASAVSEVSNARRRAMRRTLLLFAGLCILATLIFLILTLISAHPSSEDVPPGVREGVKLGSQPLDHPGKNPAGDPALAAAGGDGGDSEAPADGPTGTVTVDCSGTCAGTKVAFDNRALQDIPVDVVLPAGSHKCFLQLKGGKKKPCPHATVVVEAGKQSTIKVP
jgi:hypothetical protein